MSEVNKMIDTERLYNELAHPAGFFLMAGPCVIENEAMIMQTAEVLKRLTDERRIPFVFKSSYMKANRSSVGSFTGLGLEEGLRILQKVKETFDVPIVTDVHECCEVARVAEVADIIQIPAFLCRQTALIQTVAESGRIVNIKKGQFLAPEDMGAVLKKALATGNKKILLTERGTSFGYHNLVVDMRSFAIMKAMGQPVVFDVTHSMQTPGSGEVTGGTPQYAPMMARAALATGCVDGLFIECHPNPPEALSDANTQLPLDSLGIILDDCLRVLSPI